MSMEITNNYSNYAAQSFADSSNVKGSKKNSANETVSKSAGSNSSDSTSDYMNSLKSLAPSVDFMIGNAASSSKSGKTLTINPQLLGKMQNNPEQEKETKELIKGVESMMNLMESINKASGWTCVYKHNYIDENGKFHSVAQYRNDFMLNMSDKLREERKQNSEKLIEKSKEKAAEKAEELQEKLVEKRTENGEEGRLYSKAEQLLEDKIAASKDGLIYLDDDDIKVFIDAEKEDGGEKTSAKEQQGIGANIDLKV